MGERERAEITLPKVSMKHKKFNTLLHRIPSHCERSENGDGEEGREWILPDLLHVDDLVLYGESKEDQRMMVGQFVEVWNERTKSQCK